MTPPVRVVAVDLEVPASTVARLTDLLPPNECDVRPRARVLRAVTRQVVGSGLGVPPTALEITRQCEHCGHPDHGRPRVDDALHMSFSASHSANIGVIAMVEGDGRVVGVDIEQIRERHDLGRLAARALGPEQYSAWTAVPVPDQLTHFLQMWTAKEAYLKATGRGIAVRLAGVPAQPEGFSMRPLRAPYGFVGTVAVGRLKANGGTAG